MHGQPPRGAGREGRGKGGICEQVAGRRKGGVTRGSQGVAVTVLNAAAARRTAYTLLRTVSKQRDGTSREVPSR